MSDTSKITLGQLKTALTQAKNYTDNEIAGVTGISKVEPEALDMPKVFFYGNALPTTKDNVNLTMDYISNTAKFSSFVKLKCQGTSSMSYAKKNFTVSMFSDETRKTKLKKDFKGWGAQSKFCLKANYVDTTHTRNLSGARIAYDMVNSRPDSPFKQQLLQCPRNGAVDGFPIKLYFNGEFYGIYTWNIPKDGWMFNMDVNNSNHMVLCAEKNNDSTNTSDDILRCEFRKEWDGTDGNSWSIEFGTYSDTLKNSFNRCVSFVMTATDEEFKANIGNYFDLYSLLDYYCFSYLVAHIDGLAKNMLMATYDGAIWGACLYDMDSIYGADWQGTQFKATNIQCPEQYQDTNSLLWQRIESCFSAELYARYLELRQGALSLSNIIKHVEEIHDVIPDRVFADEKAKWTSLPGVSINTMTRFRNYMRDRAVYVDAEMKLIGTTKPCTGIVLSADTLSFTTADTQTLSVVVSPDNCTDTVTWSASPTGIVSIDNGVVTPIKNGTCTITATCGSYSDTCDVTVTLPEIVCTGISLDKDTLTLGENASNTGDLGNNLLDGAEWFDGMLDMGNGSINPIATGDKYTNINVSTPGKYTLSSTVNYGYKKIILLDTDGTFLYSVGNIINAKECVVNITRPCTARIGVYANNLDWDNTAISFIGVNFDEVITNKDVTHTLTTSDINVRYVGSEYVLTELFLNQLYNDMIIAKYDGNTYESIYKSEMSVNEQGINDIININNLGYTYYGNWEGKSFLFTALPIAYGTTADEILANMTSTTITINPTDELSKISISTILSSQLTATVTPSNCTQPVVWSVSPEGIVTVDNGLVTAVTNGEATVTATCGTYSDTCAVTVSGLESNYLAKASWQVGTLDLSNPTVFGSINTDSTTDRYTSVRIPAGKYALRSSNATWKKFRLSDSNGNVLYYYRGENITYDIIIDTTIRDDAIFTLEVSYFKQDDTIEVPSLMITDRSNLTTITLDGSLNYGIPEWDSNPSGQNGQVNVEYIISGLTAIPKCYKLEGYTFNSRLSDAESVGLAKQYNLVYLGGSIYLRFTLDMAETGVINNVESITNYLRNNPLTFKYVI